MKLFLILFFLISKICAAEILYTACEKNFPLENITLSNGKIFSLPVKSSDFDLVSVIGLVDLERLQQSLLPLGLYPLNVNNQGVVLVSFYDYKNSEMGTFREFYIVVLATRTPTNPLKGIWQALNSIRIGPNSPHPNIVFHHLMAAGDDDFGRMTSYEVWGIPSFEGDVLLSVPDHLTASASIKTILKTGEIKVKLQNNLIYNPLGLNYHVYASGFNGAKLVRSPVMACGPTMGNSWGANDHFETTGTIKALLQFLKFHPVRKEVGVHMQAVQFAPEKK